MLDGENQRMTNNLASKVSMLKGVSVHCKGVQLKLVLVRLKPGADQATRSNLTELHRT